MGGQPLRHHARIRLISVKLGVLLPVNACAVGQRNFYPRCWRLSDQVIGAGLQAKVSKNPIESTGVIPKPRMILLGIDLLHHGRRDQYKDETSCTDFFPWKPVKCVTLKGYVRVDKGDDRILLPVNTHREIVTQLNAVSVAGFVPTKMTGKRP